MFAWSGRTRDGINMGKETSLTSYTHCSSGMWFQFILEGTRVRVGNSD